MSGAFGWLCLVRGCAVLEEKRPIGYATPYKFSLKRKKDQELETGELEMGSPPITHLGVILRQQAFPTPDQHAFPLGNPGTPRFQYGMDISVFVYVCRFWGGAQAHNGTKPVPKRKQTRRNTKTHSHNGRNQ